MRRRRHWANTPNKSLTRITLYSTYYEKYQKKFIKLCEALDTTPDHLVLGCIHTKDIEQNIIDTIRLCDEETTELIYDCIDFLYARSLDKALK